MSIYYKTPIQHKGKAVARHSNEPNTISAMDTLAWTDVPFTKGEYKSAMLGEMAEWMRTNLEPGSFYVSMTAIRFKYEQDATAFLLRFL